jgi:hypothetical protein
MHGKSQLLWLNRLPSCTTSKIPNLVHGNQHLCTAAMPQLTPCPLLCTKSEWPTQHEFTAVANHVTPPPALAAHP